MKKLPDLKLTPLKILLLVFLGLLLLALLPSLYSYVSKDILKISDKKFLPLNSFIPMVTEENCTTISIRNASKTYKLEKVAIGWVLEGKKVDQSLVKSFFTSLRTLKVDNEILSKNPRNHGELAVDNNTGNLLELSGSFVTQGIFVGSPSSLAEAFYIRKQNDNSVYLAHGNLRDYVTMSKEDWLDKMVVNIPFEKISKIDVFSNSNFSLIKKDDGSYVKSLWGNEVALSADISSKLSHLFSPLNGIKLLDEVEKETFMSATFKNMIILYDSSGEALAKLDVFKSPTATWWVSETGKDVVFENDSLKTIFDLGN